MIGKKGDICSGSPSCVSKSCAFGSCGVALLLWLGIKYLLPYYPLVIVFFYYWENSPIFLNHVLHPELGF